MHAYRILVWKVVFVLGYISKTAGFKGQIPIGAIFDEYTDVFARTGYQYAISSHSQRVKEGIKFSTVYDEVDIHDNFKVASRICLQMAGGVFAFYGKTSMSSFSIIQSFSNTFHMPYISFSLSGTTDNQPKPYVIFVKPSYVDAMADLIEAFRWTQLDYLYDSDDGLMRVQNLHAKLKDVVPRVDMRFRRVDDVTDAHEDLRRLDRNQHENRKNIILDLSSYHAYNEMLRQIPEVGMNRNGYNYLLGTLDILNFNLTRFRHGGVNITGFQLVNHNSRTVKSFLGGWRNLSSTVWPGAGKDFVQVDAALSVDVVEALYQALRDMIRRNTDVFNFTFRRRTVYNYNKTRGIPCDERPVIPWMHGSDIYDSLQRVKFSGLTGNVAFDRRGLRTDYRMSVFTVSLNNGPQKIGEWDSISGLRTIYDAGDQGSANDSSKSSKSRKVITTILLPPFLTKKKAPDNGKPLLGNNRYEGFCRDLADEISEKLEFDYEIREVRDGQFGVELENGSWSGMIGELRRGVAELAIAPLTITAERERVVDFSKPFMNIGISIMIKRPDKQKPGVFSFMEPFSIQLWACITIAYVVVSVSIFLVSRFSPYEWHNLTLTFGDMIQNQFTLSNSFWFSMGALMLQGSDHCPRSAAGRIIGGAWWFFVLIIISSYTANLAAFLTIERMLTPIKSADDLVKQTEISYGTLKSGSTMKFFAKTEVPTYKTMYNSMTTATPSPFVDSIDAGVERVRNFKAKYAFLLESTMNEYYNNRKPCNTMKVGPNLNLKGFGIATPLGSDLKEKISYAVLKLKEDGTLHKLQQTWWYEKTECGSDTGHRESKKRSLSLSNVAGIFYILISGLVVSIVTGIIEIFCLKKRPIPGTAPDHIKRNDTRLTVVGTPPEQINGLINDVRIR
ncbi:glutamate receptor-like [Haliotis rufescens]|uniref:glutamate receptor-like n=1 Tax=Haliotis rufescens TaxID=6454 RepID=UPI001EAFB02C|nr:glutamate receptor-like [Haliotis rufescens]